MITNLSLLSHIITNNPLCQELFKRKTCLTAGAIEATQEDLQRGLFHCEGKL